jgi:hypothetical protein
MKKLVILLMVLSMTRIGVAYADTNSASNSSNYFFGIKNAGANLNQVLALLVGPQGKPGAAGVAGKDGLIGMNGVDGKDGLPGAPGVAGQPGKDGVSVLAAAFTGNQGTCTSGGTKFTDGAGTVTYACNGAQGVNGAQGAQGIQGVQGLQGLQGPKGETGTGGSGDGIAFGNGKLGLGACEADGKVAVGLSRKFTGDNFYFNSIRAGDSSADGDLEDTNCGGYKFTVYFEIKASPAQLTSGTPYANGDLIACTSNDTLANQAGWANRLSGGINFTKTAFTCTKNNATSAITIEDISTSDFTGTIGFTIG